MFFISYFVVYPCEYPLNKAIAKIKYIVINLTLQQSTCSRLTQGAEFHELVAVFDPELHRDLVKR